MEPQYDIKLSERELVYLMDYLMGNYAQDQDARDLARLISSKTDEYTEQIEELDHDYPNES